MANPGTYDFTLQRRVDHSFDINLKDGNNANENLTDASGGDITRSVTDVQTTNMTDNTYRYDILKIEANGDREYFIEGRIFMSEGYTAQ